MALFLQALIEVIKSEKICKIILNKSKDFVNVFFLKFENLAFKKNRNLRIQHQDNIQ